MQPRMDTMASNLLALCHDLADRVGEEYSWKDLLSRPGHATQDGHYDIVSARSVP